MTIEERQEIKNKLLADSNFNTLYECLVTNDYFKKYYVKYHFGQDNLDINNKENLLNQLLVYISKERLTDLKKDLVKAINHFLFSLIISVQIWNIIKIGALDNINNLNEKYYFKSGGNYITICDSTFFTNLKGEGLGIELHFFTNHRQYIHAEDELYFRIITYSESITENNYLNNIMIQVWNASTQKGNYYTISADIINKKQIVDYIEQVL